MRLIAALGSLILASAFATFVVPEALALDRAAVLTEIWRLWTGHLVHWSFDHFVWDGITFAVLAWLLAKLAPRALCRLLILGSPLISVAVLVAEPRLQVYGGLSGLDVALWVAVCLVIARDSLDRPTSTIAWLALVGGVLKVGFEVATGSAALVSGDVVLVTSAHIAGAVVGFLLIRLAAEHQIVAL